MKEYDNSKIHISSNSTLSVSLLIMFDTLLIGVGSNRNLNKANRYFHVIVISNEMGRACGAYGGG